MKQSIKKIIQSRIESGRPGQVYFAKDFTDVANNEQVRLALSRLVKEKLITRLGHGIYAVEQVHPVMGKIQPAYEEIAQAIADRDQITIKPTGAYALNRLGLSTQVPTKIVYMTNGQSRKIRLGKNTICFKKTTQKKMAYKGYISPLIIQAIEELGKDGIKPEMMLRLTKILAGEDFETLDENLKLAPNWVAETITKMKRSIHHV